MYACIHGWMDRWMDGCRRTYIDIQVYRYVIYLHAYVYMHKHAVV